MQVKIKKVHPDAVLPKKAHPSDAGFDLTAVAITSKPNDPYIEFDTGLVIEIPINHVGLLFPRSSISKTDLSLSNSVGVVDHGFLGKIRLRFRQTHDLPIDMCGYKVGDRVGQLIILPYPEIEFEEVEELNKTDRGEGGFGSTNGDK